MVLISKAGFKKIERIIRKILQAFHIKLFVYKIIIIPTQIIALDRLRKIMKNSSPLEKIDSGKKILFISIDARHMPHTYFEAGLAKFLQIRGHNTKTLICNGVLNMCTSHFTVDKPYNLWSCKNCSEFSKKFYETINLPYITYNEYITQNEIEIIDNIVKKKSLEECEKYIYKDIKVGFHALKSAERYFKGDKPSRQTYEPILRKELINAMISTDAAEKVLNKEKPDILVLSHGCYSSWGSFSEYFINKGITTYVWGSGENNTSRFVYPKSDFNRYFREVRHNKILDKKEGKELDDFFDRRSKGKEGQVALYGFSDTTEKFLKKQFAFDNYDKTYVMFPNVPWDAATFGEEKKMAFPNVFNWVLYTIELFRKKPKLQLIIKIHPSEIKVMESKKTITDFIAEKFNPLPENVKIISSDTKISPYSLFSFIDVGLVYTGTIGLEMSMNKIPVIPAGDAHYADKGFTYDLIRKEEYEKILFQNISLSSNQQKLAKTYAYFHFIKSFVPRSFMFSNNFIDVGWNFCSLDEVKPGKDKYIDHICNFIINGGIFQEW